MTDYRPLAFALAMAVALHSTVHAATYYVSQQGGSDSNSCGGAKATIAAGLACLASGDTLVIGPGTYPERFTGHIPDGVTITGSPGAEPVITGGPWNGQFSEGIIGPLTGNYLTWQYLKLDSNYEWSTYIASSGNRGWVVQNNELTRAFGIMIGAADFFDSTFRNNYIHHSGVLDNSTVGKPHDAYVENGVLYPSYSHVFYLKGGANNIIEGNLVHDIPDGYFVQTYDQGTIVRNNVLSNVYAIGISINGLTTWSGNRFENSGHLILKGGGNIVRDNAFIGGIAGCDVGVDFSQGSTQASNNTFVDPTCLPRGIETTTGGGNTFAAGDGPGVPAGPVVLTPPAVPVPLPRPVPQPTTVRLPVLPPPRVQLPAG